ncbi:serine/threonine-protein kinase [Nonomuraea rhizosphaerae]|uniref:serine/threonine-protein kinase n=1 Tax=Nonomuraea rhizosphaerae TaxID=2665663 RepID=UPI001C5DB3FF|nr:transporter substrate-binding domain-containing protein [Nonomuraea rhizosphaerae]
MPQISPLVAGDPSMLGSFRLTGRIGEGGQGIVYLGVTDEGEQAAIKLLHVKFSGDTIARSRFARELKAAQRVASFCTARVIEADLDGDTPYIASEYIDGRALRDIVDNDGPLRGTPLDRLAIGTATALTAIHHASIVHRDFKPDNVLIAPDGPRVVDFGIARIIDSSGTITSRAIGTPAYMAPEQIAGDDIGPYTDVFAWGATIAFAATGETVFEGNSIAVVLNRILNHEVDVSMLPEPLRGVVRSALSKSPDERPSADQILLRLLGQTEETTGASTAVLTRGVQVASDDTTPFTRVSAGTVGTGTGTGAIASTGAGPGASAPQAQAGSSSGVMPHTGSVHRPVSPRTGAESGPQTGAGPASQPVARSLLHPPEQSAVTGGEPIPWVTGAGPFSSPAAPSPVTAAAPVQGTVPPESLPPADGSPPARRDSDTIVPGSGRRTFWIALVVAAVLIAATVLVAVLNGWAQIAFNLTPAPTPTRGDGPSQPGTFNSVADKVSKTGKIVIGVKGDLPGVALQRDGRFEGFDIDLAGRIASELGAKQTEFVRLPKADREQELADGKVDLVIATYSIDKDDVEFAGPYYVAHHDVLVSDNDPDAPIDSIADLKGRRMCAPDSPSVGAVQDKVKVALVPATDYAQCMDLLRSGKVVAVPGEDLILAGFASRENQRFKILGAKLNNERYAVGIRKGDAKTCVAVKGVIADLYKKGVVKDLLAKYFPNVEFRPEERVPVMEPC